LADNVAITAGSGTTIATDDIAGVQVQRVKPTWGADGTATDTQVSQPLPVQSSIESSQMTMAGTVVTPLYAVINTSASGDTSLVSAVASKVIRVIAYTFVCDGAVAVKFTSGAAGTALTGAMSCAANGGATPPYCPAGHFQTASNTALVINLSAAVGVRGHLTYITG
jgi:hypothetical protein